MQKVDTHFFECLLSFYRCSLSNAALIFFMALAHPLTIAEDLLSKGVVEEPLNKIAAFLIIRVGCKECGNFHSMICQFFTGADQLVFLIVLMEKLHIPFEVPIPAT